MVPPSVPIPETLKGVDDLIRGDFDTFRALWFARLLLATLLVGLGLGMEGWELCHEIRSIAHHWKFEHRFHFSIPESHIPNLAKVLAFIGWIFIVVGVAGEFVAESFVSKADGYVQTFDEIVLADTTRKAGEAATSAETAHKEADAVEVEAAEITERLDTAYQQLGVLDNRVAAQGPRWRLLERNKAAFIKALKPFAPQRISFVSCGLAGAEGTEADKLQEDLSNFLDSKHDGAGWVVVGWEYATWDDCNVATTGVPPVSGGVVLVVSDEGDTALAKVSANQLADTLNKLMITTRIAADTRVDSATTVGVLTGNSFWKSVHSDPKAVFLLVGPNPLFTLTKTNSRSK